MTYEDKNFRHVGSLHPSAVQTGEHGYVIGMTAESVYECLNCGALVREAGRNGHSLWHVDTKTEWLGGDDDGR